MSNPSIWIPSFAAGCITATLIHRAYSLYQSEQISSKSIPSTTSTQKFTTSASVAASVPASDTATATVVSAAAAPTSTPTATATPIIIPPGKVINRQGQLENEVLTVEDWDARWARGAIRWHRNDVTPQLIKHANTFRKSSSNRKPRILVPLCGKAVDLVWLVTQGYQVIGIEYSTKAIDDFAREQRINKYTVTRVQSDIWRYDMLEGQLIILQCDVFSPNLSYMCCDGFVNLIWDRNAFNAIHPSRRQEYIDVLLRFKRPHEPKLMTYADAKGKGWKTEHEGSVDSYDMLLHVHDYDGPITTTPYPCPPSSIHTVLDAASTHIHHLESEDHSKDPYVITLQSTWWKHNLYGIRLR